MKHFYLIGLLMAFAFTSQAQIVFQSDLSSWANNLPTDFVGVKTSINTDSISETMVGVNAGSSAANLRNASTSSHRRFTTQSVTVVNGETYEINFWVRGQGDIRTGLYDGRSTGNGYAGYNSYQSINTTSWQLVTQTIICAKDTTDAEFILSVLNTAPGVGLDIDSVVISIGAVSPPTTTSIYGIQFTTDPNGDSPLLNTQVITGGVVTAVDSSGYYIQENQAAWSGIYVFDSSLPSRGDSVLIEGTVVEYFNSTQISGLTSFTNLGAGASVTGVSLSTDDANLEMWESVLVTVSAPCTDDDVAANFGQWELNDGSGVVLIDDYYYAYNPSVGTTYLVTGPVTYNFNERKILPRDAQDVQIGFGVDEVLFSDLNVYPVPASDNFNVDLGERASVSYLISDFSGRLIQSGQFNNRNSVVNVNDFATGQYLMQLTNENGTQSIRFSVR